jgi:hypothetical protein
VIGWRVWRVRDGGLVSPVHGRVGWDATSVRADCPDVELLHELDEPEPPGWRCTCGISAARTLPGLIDLFTTHLWIKPSPDLAIGAVRLGGCLLPDYCPDSVRATHATVLKLWASQPHMEELASRYGPVDVGHMDRLGDEFERFERAARLTSGGPDPIERLGLVDARAVVRSRLFE